jgi:hypothetical protein
MPVKLLQSEKEKSLMTFTLSGIVISVSFLHEVKTR